MTVIHMGTGAVAAACKEMNAGDESADTALSRVNGVHQSVHMCKLTSRALLSVEHWLTFACIERLR